MKFSTCLFVMSTCLGHALAGIISAPYAAPSLYSYQPHYPVGLVRSAAFLSQPATAVVRQSTTTLVGQPAPAIVRTAPPAAYLSQPATTLVHAPTLYSPAPAALVRHSAADNSIITSAKSGGNFAYSSQEFHGFGYNPITQYTIHNFAGASPLTYSVPSLAHPLHSYTVVKPHSYVLPQTYLPPVTSTFPVYPQRFPSNEIDTAPSQQGGNGSNGQDNIESLGAQAPEQEIQNDVNNEQTQVEQENNNMESNNDNRNFNDSDTVAVEAA